MISRRGLFAGAASVAALVGVGAAAVWPGFRKSLEFHRKRVSHGSSIISSAYGDIEYAVAGSGEPALIIQGAGGGFDQGIDSSKPLLSAGFQVIAPSRFGYLRSGNPAQAMPEMQADAYATLLDHLNLTRATVIGISAGAVSAIQFAARHPKRCSALVLIVPAATAAGPEIAAQGPAPQGGTASRLLVEYVVKSDLLFWLGCKFAPRQIYGSVLATNAGLLDTASASERARADAMMWNILPISARAEGLANDVRFTSTPMKIDLKAITVPTLTISLEDDLYGTAAAARHIAATVPGARSVIFPTGGHIFVGREAEVFGEVVGFVHSHGSRGQPI